MFLLFVILVILIIWAASSAGRNRYYRDYYHSPGGQAPSETRQSDGLNVLNERYAKGEITKEEYEQKKKDILS